MDVLLLLAGVLCAALGGEIFVRGVLSIASMFRIAPGIVAATLAAFATSAPELAVSVTSALEQHSTLGVGDALGSNVANIALVGGLALLLGSTVSHHASSKRYLTTALYAPIITAGFLYDGELSRLESTILLSVFLVWLVLTIRDARQDRSTLEPTGQTNNTWRTTLNLLSGLALLITAGLLVAAHAPPLARWFGISEFVIGATVVAVGTSMPEIAVVIVSRLKRTDDVGLGTLIGSNIFNGLAIVPIASLITPPQLTFTPVLVELLFGLLSVLIIAVPAARLQSRTKGIYLLALYLAHVVLVTSS